MEPFAACAPLHPPDAVHPDALVEDQFSMALVPAVIFVALADRLTVGIALEPLEPTVTVVLAGEDVPPAPVQVRV